MENVLTKKADKAETPVPVGEVVGLGRSCPNVRTSSGHEKGQKATVKSGHGPTKMGIQPLDIKTARQTREGDETRKYLVFRGWCVLGVEGTLTQDQAGEETDIQLSGELDDRGLYYFVAPGADLSQAVDLDVIKVRSTMPSETSSVLPLDLNTFLRTCRTHKFKGELPNRDASPFQRGSELILANRPHYDEDMDDQ